MRKAIWFLSAAAVLAGVAWQCASGCRVRGTHAKKSAPLNNPDPVYRANPRSRVFHGPACKFYESKGCIETFSSRERAVDAGFKPCTICLP